jgi:hypothetical protein
MPEIWKKVCRPDQWALPSVHEICVALRVAGPWYFQCSNDWRLAGSAPRLVLPPESRAWLGAGHDGGRLHCDDGAGRSLHVCLERGFSSRVFTGWYHGMPRLSTRKVQETLERLPVERLLTLRCRERVAKELLQDVQPGGGPLFQ